MDISVLRNLVIRYGARLKLKPNEQVCLWHLLDHDFTGKGYVFPSETTIAKKMGLKSKRQVGRLIQNLKEKRYIAVREKPGFSNRYTFGGIVRDVTPFLKEEVDKTKERARKLGIDRNVYGDNNNTGQKSPGDTTKMSTPPGQKCPPKHCNRSTANNTDILAPQNGAVKNVHPESPKDKKPEPSKFDRLLNFWYEEKGEPNPGTVPPRYDRKKYVEIVAERINDGKTWREISAAIRNYWRVVKSPAHYYKHQGSISWFIAKGIDQFWDELKPLENFKDRNIAKNGTTKTNSTILGFTPDAYERYRPEAQIGM